MKRFIIAFVLVLTCATVAFGAEPVVDFNHKCMKLHTEMKLSRLKKLEKYLPRDLRREIGDEYYPQIRAGLSKSDTMEMKGAQICLEHMNGDTLEMRLDFPKFVMTIRDITWADLDEIYLAYFAPEADTGMDGSGLDFNDSDSR